MPTALRAVDRNIGGIARPRNCAPTYPAIAGDWLYVSTCAFIAIREYNASVPGVLRNALGWFSGPPQMALMHRPVAIIGASSGNFGMARAHREPRRIFAHVHAYTVPRPEVMVFHAANAFDATGRLHDNQTRELLRTLAQTLVSWTDIVRPRHVGDQRNTA